MADPYKEGGNARIEDQSISDAPHPAGSGNWKRWTDGWIDEHANHLKQTGQQPAPPHYYAHNPKIDVDYNPGFRPKRRKV